MRVTTLTLSTCALVLCSTYATAQTTSEPSSTGPGVQQRIDARQQRQEQRIQAGVQSGALTTKEAELLKKGEVRIDAAQQRAQADGTVTAKEGKHLSHMTERESNAIYRQKHDRQRDTNHDGRRDRGAPGKGGKS